MATPGNVFQSETLTLYFRYTAVIGTRRSGFPGVLSTHDARKTLEGFSARLRDEMNLDSLSAELVSVVQETMQPARFFVAAS